MRIDMMAPAPLGPRSTETQISQDTALTGLISTCTNHSKTSHKDQGDTTLNTLLTSDASYRDDGMHPFVGSRSRIMQQLREGAEVRGSAAADATV